MIPQFIQPLVLIKSLLLRLLLSDLTVGTKYEYEQVHTKQCEYGNAVIILRVTSLAPSMLVQIDFILLKHMEQDGISIMLFWAQYNTLFSYTSSLAYMHTDCNGITRHGAISRYDGKCKLLYNWEKLINPCPEVKSNKPNFLHIPWFMFSQSIIALSLMSRRYGSMNWLNSSILIAEGKPRMMQL